MISVIPDNFIIDNNHDIRFAISVVIDNEIYTTDSIFRDMTDVNIGQYYPATNNALLKLRYFDNRIMLDVYEGDNHILATGINLETFNIKINQGKRSFTPENSPRP